MRARLWPPVCSRGEPVEIRRRDIWITPGQTSRDFIKATQCRVLILKSSGVRRQFPEANRGLLCGAALPVRANIPEALSANLHVMGKGAGGQAPHSQRRDE